MPPRLHALYTLWSCLVAFDSAVPVELSISTCALLNLSRTADSDALITHLQLLHPVLTFGLLARLALIAFIPASVSGILMVAMYCRWMSLLQMICSSTPPDGATLVGPALDRLALILVAIES